MKCKRITKNFFNDKTEIIAEKLLGKVLNVKSNNKIYKLLINEVEAYTEDDEASHSYKGKVTKRNYLMFEDSGQIYVYLIYGFYHCLNIVTGKKGKGEAILIRGGILLNNFKDFDIQLKETDNLEKNYKNLIKKKEWLNLFNGPGKICKRLDINKEFNKFTIFDKYNKIYLEDCNFKPINIIKTKRIGINKGLEKDWRFYSKEFTLL